MIRTCCALLLLVSLPALVQAAPPRKQAPAKLLAVHGEVGLKRDTSKTDAFEPASAPADLSRRDEVQTQAGTAAIHLESGMVLDLSENTLVVIINGGGSGIDAFVARGSVLVRPQKGGEVRPVQLSTLAGRTTLRGRGARVRVQGNTTQVMVYDGTANLWGKGAVTLHAGQVAQVEKTDKGGTAAAPRPLLGAPAWVSTDGLYLHGERSPRVELQWKPVPEAARYRVELTAAEDGGLLPGAVQVDVVHTGAELPDLQVGSYQAYVSAVDARGAHGPRSAPVRVVVAGLSGMVASGRATVPAGTLPRVTAPPGLTAALNVDGEIPGEGGLRPGSHRLEVTVDGLSTHLALFAPPAREEGSPNDHLDGRSGRRSGPAEERCPAPAGEAPDIAHPPFLGDALPASAQAASGAPRETPDIAHPPFLGDLPR